MNLNEINRKKIFQQIKLNGCKCHFTSNKNDLTQEHIQLTIEKNKNAIINGKIGNSWKEVIVN